MRSLVFWMVLSIALFACACCQSAEPRCAACERQKARVEVRVEARVEARHEAGKHAKPRTPLRTALKKALRPRHHQR